MGLDLKLGLSRLTKGKGERQTEGDKASRPPVEQKAAPPHMAHSQLQDQRCTKIQPTLKDAIVTSTVRTKRKHHCSYMLDR